MKLLLALLFLVSTEAHAAKLMSQKVRSYFPVLGMGSTSSVAYTGTAGSSFEWTPSGGASTILLRIITTTAAHIKVAASPTATTADPYLPANTEMLLEVPTGSKVSAIQNATGGFLYTTEMLLYPNLD